ncbi:unnamed protein product [Miscanthus lutarioriparius]|uniref:Uncharacterized protein n=1 Tax=Miscanthus lutarioriparius TaxID=422564 RepID=A0A811PZH3_9POAL|nr:unnamed protein product [Miscanthus lutarioriparius]
MSGQIHRSGANGQPVEDTAGLIPVTDQLRTTMRMRILEYVQSTPSLAEWQPRLPDLVKWLEETLYTKFPNKNDYYTMMKGPVEPQLHFAIMTLSAQNQQNPQMSGQAAQINQVSGSGVVVGFGGADGILQHQLMQDTAVMSGVDQQFIMLRTAMRERIFEYIGKKQTSAEWRKRLPELANRLEEILYKTFPNKNDYYNMMKGPIEPQLQFAIRTLSAQNQQNPQMSGQTAQMNQVSGSGVVVGELMQDMAAMSGTDQQFVMLRTAMREKIFEYIGKKQTSAEWRKRLPELANRLEEILYRTFPNKNDYYSMMKGPIEPQLQFAIRTLSAQNQQNPQMSGQAAQMNQVSGSGVVVGVGGADGILPHQLMQDMAAMSGTDQQFVMLRTAMREKIFEYIGKKQMSAEWRKRLPELANRLEEILYRTFPNKNDYYNMMKGPIEPQLQFAIKTLVDQHHQYQQNLQLPTQTPSSSSSNQDVNLDGLSELFASLHLQFASTHAEERD